MRTIEAFKSQVPQPLRQTTLVFLRRDGKVLLAMKKRGFGKGRWNGVGGKVEAGESLEQAAIREAREEIGVEITHVQPAAILDFYFPHVPTNQDWNQQVHVYFADAWEGEPEESEEMAPRWFAPEDFPWADMWRDDPHWLPFVLDGKQVEAEFAFAPDQSVEYLAVSVLPAS